MDNQYLNTAHSLISIVTICYNAAKELPLTMDSVLAQDYSNFEYIIQDGNSCDGSMDIIESYRHRFTERGINFIYNRAKDEGIYDAMNKAVTSCNGDYINFMNAGDCFYNSNVISNVFDRNEEISSDIIYGDCVEFEFGRFNLFARNFDKIEEVMPFSHQSVFAKATLLKEYPFNKEYRYSADYDFLLNAYKLNKSFEDSKTVICITTKDGLSSVNYHDMLLESAQILKSHGLYHHTEKELSKIEKTLKVKQFVLDHFPVFIKKFIRGIQIKSRGQEFICTIPEWYKKYKLSD